MLSVTRVVLNVFLQETIRGACPGTFELRLQDVTPSSYDEWAQKETELQYLIVNETKEVVRIRQGFADSPPASLHR